MRKLALALSLLPLASCQTLTWRGHTTEPSSDQKDLSMNDIAALSNQYELESYFRGVRRRSDGRNNAFGRDLMRVQEFFDRHFWNYDQNDPAVNYPSDTTKFEHFGRFLLGTGSMLPPVDEIVTR